MTDANMQSSNSYAENAISHMSGSYFTNGDNVVFITKTQLDEILAYCYNDRQQLDAELQTVRQNLANAQGSLRVAQAAASNPSVVIDSQKAHLDFLTNTNIITQQQRNRFEALMDSMKGLSCDICKLKGHDTSYCWFNGQLYRCATAKK